METARELIKDGAKIRLPVDIVIGDGFDNDAKKKVMAMSPVPDGWRILDIGPETVAAYSKAIQSASTVVWNGPMGVFEFPNFAEGTFGIARAVADSKRDLHYWRRRLGGGDQAVGPQDKITHISTGGGASLEMLEGIPLPGVAALQDK